MKPHVKDFWSITPQHYINAGEAGLTHFNFLMNSIIEDVNNSSIDELNRAFALLLYEGHNKDETSHRSYRTISNCPMVAKGLDIYIRDLFSSTWNTFQADTQYQGPNSSHELSSLLVTEVIQTSPYKLKQPVYLV